MKGIRTLTLLCPKKTGSKNEQLLKVMDDD